MRRFLILVVCLVPLCGRADVSELKKLRESYAREYFKAEAHLRLAKYLADYGDRLNAFFISETARRQHFPEEAFDLATRVVLRGDTFDNSALAEKRLRDDLAASPSDVKALIELADIHVSHSEWKAAEEELRRALVADPESVDAVAMLAEILRRTGREAEGDKLQEDWLKARPNSREAWLDRVDEAVGSRKVDALKVVNAALAKFPGEAILHFHRAHLLHLANDLDGATAEYVRAAELDPKSAYIQGWTARFFLKAKNDREKALEYYLSAYFLDPHFYDTEYAEGRVRTLASQLASSRYASARASGRTPLQLLETADPVVAGLAMKDVDNEWSPGARQKLVILLAHEDLRYGAADILARHVGAEFDEELRALLQSPDLLTRSAAAYIAGARWKEDVVPILTPWLDEPADLLRYDAVSILLEMGGERGKKELRKFAAAGKVKDARLKAILDAMDVQKKDP